MVGLKRYSTWIVACICVFLTGACSQQASEPSGPEDAVTGLQISSPAFANGEQIPVNYTCDGEDISPALEWGGVPENAHSLVLIVDDPDAPTGTWLHWLIYDIPGNVDGLPEGAASNPAIARIGSQGQNDFSKTDYGGPCPPGGPAHHYYFRLYALDELLNLPPESTRSDVEAAMKTHILAEAQLMGVYGR
jgi:Raf kinase inhibitor-like YbhB/YbcL family protein